ncbi:MAG: response regulator transcription factor [Sphingobacteriales bacterium]|nr:MAG: response regulator transcription factor [Sphingobacteriales bacterium]
MEIHNLYTIGEDSFMLGAIKGVMSASKYNAQVLHFSTASEMKACMSRGTRGGIIVLLPMHEEKASDILRELGHSMNAKYTTLVICRGSDHAVAQTLYTRGARGVVFELRCKQEFLKAVETLHSERYYASMEYVTADRGARRVADPVEVQMVKSFLTDQQRKVIEVRRRYDGLSRADMAAKLCITVATWATHVRMINALLKAHNLPKLRVWERLYWGAEDGDHIKI